MNSTKKTRWTALLGIAGAIMLTVSFFHSFFGLYPATYWAGTVTGVVDPDLPSSRVRHVLVRSRTEREQKVIVRRGDTRSFEVGDHVYVCQPFGPPHVERPAQGFLFWQMSCLHLTTPLAVLGIVLLMTSVTLPIVEMIKNMKAEQDKE
ncbi:MAG: hypothetical protein EOM12_13650 [Verrucomicrobiae bacterium]|nr:hypothetical protein [Verrucomicrobiae bacterium]